MPPKRDLKPANRDLIPANIARLNSLLQESESLAHQLNRPLTCLLTALMLGPVRMAIDLIDLSIRQRLQNTLTDMNATKSTWIFSTLMFFGATVSTILLFGYLLWRLSSSITLRCFPQGIGFSRHPGTLRNKKKLPSEKDIHQEITTLTTLIKAQEKKKNKIFYGSLAMSLILPVIFFARTKASNTSLGATLATNKTSELQIMMVNITNMIQILPILSYIFHRLSNYNTPKQLENYRRKLDAFNPSQKKWQLLPSTTGLKNTKACAVFMLDLGNEEQSITLSTATDGASQTVSVTTFFAELHRSFLENNILLFLSGDTIAYVCHTEFSSRAMNRAQRQFMQYLLRGADSEKRSEDVIKKLNSLTNLVHGNTDITWDFYYAITSSTQREERYYLDIQGVPKRIRDKFIEAVNTISIQMTVEGSLISVKGITNDETTYARACTLLKTANTLQHDVSAATAGVGVGVTVRRHPPKTLATPVTEEATTDIHRVVPLPASLHFSNGVSFFSDTTARPATRAYPLHVPFLPEGRAYACVHPAIVEAVEEHVSSQHIINCLERGNVHGVRGSAKTKAGGVGIQITDESYRTIEGQSIPAAALKMKFPNNIRIFGRPVESTPTGERLYRFDGWRFGH